MTFFLYFIYTILALSLEGVLRYLPMISIRIDFVWILILYIAFFLPDFRGGGLVVIFLALLQESLGAPTHGFVVLSYMVTYYFLRLTRQHLLFEGGVAQMIWISMVSIGQKSIEIGILHWQGYHAALDPWRLVPAAALQGLVAPWLFILFRKMDRFSSEM